MMYLRHQSILPVPSRCQAFRWWNTAALWAGLQVYGSNTILFAPSLLWAQEQTSYPLHPRSFEIPMVSLHKEIHRLMFPLFALLQEFQLRIPLYQAPLPVLAGNHWYLYSQPVSRKRQVIAPIFSLFLPPVFILIYERFGEGMIKPDRWLETV